MSDPTFIDELHFAWEGADHPDGPWHHLRVLELRGEEALSRPFWFEIDLRRDAAGADVSVSDLVGARAALKVATGTQPSHRIIHGVIASASELALADSQTDTRLRVTLRPAFHRAAIMRKSTIYLDKTLRQIIEQVLQRTSLGAALEPSTSDRPLVASDDLHTYASPRLTFAWALRDNSRIDDPAVRPYCVQYDESDLDFVSRLLEEEGIAYHFEHDDAESVFVMSDFDGGRVAIPPDAPLGPQFAKREIFDWCAGGRLRPRSVFLHDYDWQKPDLDLGAISLSGVTDFTDMRFPGRYEGSPAPGQKLAAIREQRFDTEREHATARSHCRLLGAGTHFRLDHPVAKFGGVYLVTAVRHHATNHDHATSAEEPYHYLGELELVRCGTAAEIDDSRFRPARLTPRPRIFGTQTAVVTADPTDPDAEINVGGASDLGCVRVRFHWDIDEGRHAKEPTSCWVRVSQFFAGGDHGALWHPRVNDEVIVEFLDGDPDRPIVTGRVYNGRNLAPTNATQRPTYSAIKSLTSPYDGNYNLIAFEDLQGSEEIIIHAARDWSTNVKRNCSRGVGVNEDVHIKGDQTIKVDGNRSLTVGVNQTFDVGNTFSCTVGVDYDVTAGASINMTAPKINASCTLTTVKASIVSINASTLFELLSSYTKVEGGPLEVTAAWIKTSSGALSLNADGTVVINGGTVAIHGGKVDINGGAEVNVKAGAVNLNC